MFVQFLFTGQIAHVHAHWHKSKQQFCFHSS